MSSELFEDEFLKPDEELEDHKEIGHYSLSADSLASVVSADTDIPKRRKYKTKARTAPFKGISTTLPNLKTRFEEQREKERNSNTKLRRVDAISDIGLSYFNDQNI